MSWHSSDAVAITEIVPSRLEKELGCPDPIKNVFVNDDAKSADVHILIGYFIGCIIIKPGEMDIRKVGMIRTEREITRDDLRVNLYIIDFQSFYAVSHKHAHSDFLNEGGCLTRISNFYSKFDSVAMKFVGKISVRGDGNIGSKLALCRNLESSVGLPSQPESINQSDSADRNQNSLPSRYPNHLLRCRIHSLLRNEVAMLAVSGFFLCALAGTGGFFSFDNYNG